MRQNNYSIGPIPNPTTTNPYAMTLLDHIEQYGGQNKNDWGSYCGYVEYTMKYLNIEDPVKAKLFMSLMGYTFFSRLVDKFPDILEKEMTFDMVKYMGELIYDKYGKKK